MVSFGRKGATAEVEAPEQSPAPQPAVSAPAPSQLAAFPRVNLIPDEIAQEARVRRAKLVVGGAVAASVVAVGGLYLMAAGEVSSAQQDLGVATARSATLSAEATKYADVPKVRSDLASAQAQQALAMGGEVRWSFMLNNLALTIPPGSSLTSFQAVISGASPDAAAPTAANAASAGSFTSILGQPGIGSIAYEGEALENAKVSAFLEAMTKSTGLLDPFATQTARKTDRGPSAKAVTFTAQATIGPKALSHRYDVKGN